MILETSFEAMEPQFRTLGGSFVNSILKFHLEGLQNPSLLSEISQIIFQISQAMKTVTETKPIPLEELRGLREITQGAITKYFTDTHEILTKISSMERGKGKMQSRLKEVLEGVEQLCEAMQNLQIVALEGIEQGSRPRGYAHTLPGTLEHVFRSLLPFVDAVQKSEEVNNS